MVWFIIIIIIIWGGGGGGIRVLLEAWTPQKHLMIKSHL
jgi:hypothetical protein